ncbi:hypothetical protein PN498_16995 [Oscillatoria sp. CS-180]|uniref:hypothetical protein n=1 Tax=Oscillatoria sp. CS-180 TaxID=3021720 RepID=UPI0023304D3E|nr:hypothetical protein [Oscillatoria sp. CS-180]MDB9527694.1 hypothetical protein [Oscillatoria sp. CS-180]
MASGIYAIANFGSVQLYVGEVSHLKSRWPKMMAQLDEGTFPDEIIQQEWQQHKGDRRFNFYTAEQVNADRQIRGRKLFKKDYQKSQTVEP